MLSDVSELMAVYRLAVVVVSRCPLFTVYRLPVVHLQKQRRRLQWSNEAEQRGSNAEAVVADSLAGKQRQWRRRRATQRPVLAGSGSVARRKSKAEAGTQAGHTQREREITEERMGVVKSKTRVSLRVCRLVAGDGGWRRLRSE
ncbi:hypothetical protein AHAS_Ahas05G0260000 [Arachis hypogaea]